MDASAARERLYDTFSEPDMPVDARIEQALTFGTEYLDLAVGYVTRIEEDRQEIVHAAGDHERIQPSERYALDRAYCRCTVDSDGVLAVSDVEASTITGAAIETFGFESYIGAKIVVHGDVYGTACFADGQCRATSFTESEEVFVELLAKLVGSALDQQAYEQALREHNRQLRTEKDRFEAIAETSSDIIFRVDDAGRFTYVSSVVECVLGYQPDELVGEPFKRSSPNQRQKRPLRPTNG